MKFYTLKSTLLVSAIAGALSVGLLNISQAMQGEHPVIKSKKISKQEWERARNYFTDTVLVDQHGKKHRFYSDVLDGRIVMINVMYSNCKGACPMMTKMLTHVKDEVGDRFGKDIFFVSISNNPERDTPEAMARFAKKQNAMDKGWYFLTGEKPELEKIVRKLGFYSNNFEEHTSLLLAGNTRTGHWIKIKPSTPLPGITIKLNQLADEG